MVDLKEGTAFAKIVMTKNEVLARQEAILVYGEGTRIEVSRNERSGQLRILDTKGKYITGWRWDESSLSQKTEDQAWFVLLGMIRDDAVKAKVKGD